MHEGIQKKNYSNSRITVAYVHNYGASFNPREDCPHDTLYMTLRSSVQVCYYLYSVSIYPWFKVWQFYLIYILTNCVSDWQIYSQKREYFFPTFALQL